MPGDTNTILLISGSTFSTKSTIVAASVKGTKVRVYDVYSITTQTGPSLLLAPNSTGTTPMIRTVATGLGITSGEATDSFCEGCVFPNGLYASTGAGYAGGWVTYAVEL